MSDVQSVNTVHRIEDEILKPSLTLVVMTMPLLFYTIHYLERLT